MSLANMPVRVGLILILCTTNGLGLGAAAYAWYAIDRMNEQYHGAIGLQNPRERDRAADLAASKARDSPRNIAFLALLSALVGAAAGFATASSVTRRLQRATKVARMIVAGDLSAAAAEEHARHQHGELVRSLYEMCTTLSMTVERIRRASQSVAGESTQIAAGNAALSGARSNRLQVSRKWQPR